MLFDARALALAAVPVAVLGLGGCTTLRETQPAHTATEQLLMSHAAEIAATRLAAALPERGAVFLDATRVKGDGSDYAVAAARAALVKRGLTLVGDAKDSDLTVELRMGALSIDQTDVVFGLPAGYIPLPGTVQAFPIPELSLYSNKLRRGVAEFAALAYETKTRRAVASIGPTGGERDLRERKILTVFKFGSRLERAGDVYGNRPRPVSALRSRPARPICRPSPARPFHESGCPGPGGRHRAERRSAQEATLTGTPPFDASTN